MFVCAVFAFIAGLSFWSSMGCNLPIMPLYVGEELRGEAYVGLVMAAFATGLILFRGALGRLADRWGRKRSMQLGLIIAGTIPLLYGLLPHVPIVIALRPIHALAVGSFATGYAALMGDIAPPGKRGQVIGFLSLVNPLGLGLGPWAGDTLRQEWGYGAAFAMAATFAMIGLVCTLFVQDVYTPCPACQQKPLPIWELVTTARVRSPAFVLLAVGMVFGIVSTYLPKLLEELQLGVRAGTFYAAASMAQFIFRLPVASLGDRYGRGIFITFSLVCYALSMLIVATATSSEAIVVGAIIDGVAAGTAIPTVIAWLADRTSPPERGTVMGTAWLGFDVGIATSASVVGWVMQLLPKGVPLVTVFWIASLISLLALAVFLVTCSDNVAESVKFALGRGKDKYAITNQT
ncbi:MAG: MFS transporter [Pseudanabaenaceae cyanobacterium]